MRTAETVRRDVALIIDAENAGAAIDMRINKITGETAGRVDAKLGTAGRPGGGRRARIQIHERIGGCTGAAGIGRASKRHG